MVGKKKVEEYEIQKAAEQRKKAAKEAKEKEEKEELRLRFQEEAERKEKEKLRQKEEKEKAVREALEALEAKAAKERDRSPKTTYSSGRDSGVSFDPPLRRDGKVIYVKQVYSDDDEAYISSSGAGRHEEYVPVDRTGRAYQTHARARRPSSGELYEEYLGNIRPGRGGPGGW
jgi:outer membrane translocation and assembly module TamA